MKIEGNLYLESDEYQFVLKEYLQYFDKRNGKQKYKTIGYYTNISDAIKKLIRLKLHESKAATLHELQDEMKRVDVWAKGLFEPIEV